MAFTASAPADQSISHRLADTVKGGELSYMALAMEREQIVYRSLLMQPGAVPTDPTPIPARLVRGCIAMAFTASVPADQSSHRLVLILYRLLSRAASSSAHQQAGGAGALIGHTI